MAIIFEPRSLESVLFGSTFAYIGSYLPGWFRIYYGLEVIGLIFSWVYLDVVYKGAKDEGKTTVIVFAFLNLGTVEMLGEFAVYWLIFIMSKTMAKGTKTQMHRMRSYKQATLVSNVSH